MRLDEVTGPWFSVLCWNNDPRAVLGDEAERWLALGARLVELRPEPQLRWAGGTATGSRSSATAPER